MCLTKIFTYIHIIVSTPKHDKLIYYQDYRAQYHETVSRGTLIYQMMQIQPFHKMD